MGVHMNQWRNGLLVKAQILAATSATAMIASAFTASQAAAQTTTTPPIAQASEVQSTDEDPGVQAADQAPEASATAQGPGIEGAAQTSDNGDIVVTGSRVRNGFSAPTPVTIVTADELNRTANTNIADAVNQLPAFSGSLTPRGTTGNITSGAAGVNALNLRGIGTNRVLVLQDGRRVINASVSTGFVGVDINQIPNELISRVDVVTGGASAVYGSDALSGVVNFILDKKFTGLKGSIEGGITTYGDDRNGRVSLTAGTAFAGGAGHILLFGEGAYNEGIRGNPRPWNAEGGSVIVNPNRTATNGQPNFLVARRIGLNNGTPGGLITRGPLRGIYFGPGGVPLQYDFGLLSINNVIQGGSWRVSRLDAGLDLDPQIERVNLFGRISYELTDNLEAHAEYQWAYAHTKTNSNNNRTQDNVTILSGNPFIPAAIQAQMTALRLPSIVLGSTNGDVPRIISNNRRTLQRIQTGVSGRFGAFDSDWSWDAYYQISKQELDQRAESIGYLPRILLGRDAVRAPNGTIVCRSTLTNPTNGCVPYNYFGTGVNSQAAIDYFTGVSARIDYLRQDAGAITVRGEPFSLWAGPISVAFGVEHRYERVRSTVDPDNIANNYLSGNYKPNFGKLSVTEGFLEAAIPVVRDQSWTKSLDLNAAVRATDYTTSGYVTTWKVGAVWQPVEDLRIRLTRSRDIRAASLGELFAGGVTASGVPFRDPATGQTTNGFQQTQGNPDLQPEKADTTGIGVVFSPTFIPRFQASVDYFNIDISGAIVTPSGQAIINGCSAGITSLCANIVRTGGQISTVFVAPQNIVSQLARGIDIEASYRLPLDTLLRSWSGDLSFRAFATYVLALRTVDPTLSVNRLVDGRGVLGNFATTGFAGLTAPKFRALASVTYSNDFMSATFRVRHTAGGTYNNAFTECASACPANNTQTIDNNRIEADTLFDAAFTVKPFRSSPDTELFLNIQNIFNTDPPFVGGNTLNTSFSGQANSRYDVLGRVFLAGFRFKI
jgi:iron complex outermembrane receptor protein